MVFSWSLGVREGVLGVRRDGVLGVRRDSVLGVRRDGVLRARLDGGVSSVLIIRGGVVLSSFTGVLGEKWPFERPL